MAEQKPVAAPSLVDQYDIEATPAATPVPAETPSSTPAPAAEAATPTRDPHTGKFVAKASAPSARLLHLAKSLGMEDEEIASLSPQDLRATIQEIQLEKLQTRRESPSVQAAPPEGAQPVITSPVATPDPFDLGDLEHDLDVRLAKLVKALIDGHKKLSQQLAALSGREHARTVETMAEKMDRWFSSHEERFGKGTRETLPKDGGDYQRRCALIAVAEKVGKDLSVEAALDKANALLYPDKPKAAPAPTPAQAFEEEWNQGAVARPTHREGAGEPEGTQKAIRGVESYLAERGSNNHAPSIADQFPD